MSEYLLFQLYGPMAAWGDIAVGEQRPTMSHPSKSATLGLLAAALGIRRDEEEKHKALAASYGLAVRVASPGELLRDYHTTQVPPQRRGVRHFTRREELAADTLHTILSQRDYRMDACCTAALWVQNAPAPHSLQELESALQRPRFTLYLGRKSCPPALPLAPQVIQSATLKEAFDKLPVPDTFLEYLPPAKQTAFYWEYLDRSVAGFSEDGVHMAHTRRDWPLSRRRWQFTDREEFYHSRPIPEGQG